MPGTNGKTQIKQKLDELKGSFQGDEKTEFEGKLSAFEASVESIKPSKFFLDPRQKFGMDDRNKFKAAAAKLREALKEVHEKQRPTGDADANGKVKDRQESQKKALDAYLGAWISEQQRLISKRSVRLKADPLSDFEMTSNDPSTLNPAFSAFKDGETRTAYGWFGTISATAAVKGNVMTISMNMPGYEEGEFLHEWNKNGVRDAFVNSTFQTFNAPDSEYAGGDFKFSSGTLSDAQSIIPSLIEKGVNCRIEELDRHEWSQPLKTTREGTTGHNDGSLTSQGMARSQVDKLNKTIREHNKKFDQTDQKVDSKEDVVTPKLDPK